MPPATTFDDHASAGREIPAPSTSVIGTDKITVRFGCSLEEWREIESWMIDEGWDPGFGDASAATALDPGALVIGLLDTEPVAAISVLRVSGLYAAVGNYLVHPDYRGRGFGLATWRAALPHAGGRVMGLDAVPDQVDTYAGAGFTAAYATIGYRGTVPPANRRCVNRGIRLLEPGDRAAVVALDAESAPFERSGFLAAWTAMADIRTLVHQERDGQVTGFGAIRPSRTGYRIGPLIAEDPAVARDLFSALTAAHIGDQVVMNCPEPNSAGRELAGDFGLLCTSHTVRMYSGHVRDAALTRCYSTASLAYG